MHGHEEKLLGFYSLIGKRSALPEDSDYM